MIREVCIDVQEISKHHAWSYFFLQMAAVEAVSVAGLVLAKNIMNASKLGCCFRAMFEFKIKRAP